MSSVHGSTSLTTGGSTAFTDFADAVFIICPRIPQLRAAGTGRHADKSVSAIHPCAYAQSLLTTENKKSRLARLSQISASSSQAKTPCIVRSLASQSGSQRGWLGFALFRRREVLASAFLYHFALSRQSTDCCAFGFCFGILLLDRKCHSRMATPSFHCRIQNFSVNSLRRRIGV